MSSTQLPKLLNRAYDDVFEFPQFVRLPWELRNQIWVSALQTRRLIQAELGVHPPDTDSSLVKGQEVVSHGDVYLVVTGFQLLPALLRVNSESRIAAFDFYRMRVPCLLKHPRKRYSDVTPGILFLNPEHDILWLHDEQEGAETIAHIVRTIVQHDPLGVGLCNMAVTASQGSQGWHPFERINGMEYAAYQSPFRYVQNQSSKNIRELYLVLEIDSYRVQLVREQYKDLAWPSTASTRKPMLQAYTPIASGVPSFSLLPHDPRPIADDLARLFITDLEPHTIVSAWGNTFFSTSSPDEPFGWGLDSSRVTARVLIMCRDENPLQYFDPAYDAPSLQRSRFASSESQIYRSQASSVPSISLTTDEETRNRDSSVAVGFWLFPFKAFTPNNALVYPTSRLTLWDVSDSPPELGLFHLPADTTT
ncbi:hypothetical protein F5Y18DRAFT_210946 [Xylariaceae sp. FL1019]|nr:hypothetical protein F5Y18DRAFT_210946 [Xylariaceae sp. FL1019]